MIRDAVRDVSQDYDDLMAQLPRERNSQVDLLEVCCPKDSGLANMMEKRGGTAARIGLHNHDLGTRNGLQGALDMAEQLQPLFMWVSCVSLPCGPFSPIQTLFKEMTEDQLRRSQLRQKKARKLIKGGIEMVRRQIERGGDIAWEWPDNNKGWHEPSVKKLDGCMVGVKTPDTGEPMRKQWRIVTTFKAMKEALNIRCNRQHQHAECLGHGRATSSGFYPEDMCHRMVKTILAPAFLSDEETASRILGLQDEPLLTSKLEVPDRKRAEALIHRLHVRAGHHSNEVLASVLRSLGYTMRW